MGYPLLTAHHTPQRICDSADFETTPVPDSITRGGNMPGVVDGKSGILSVWWRLDSVSTGNEIQNILENLGTSLVMRRRETSHFEIVGLDNVSSAVVLDMFTLSTPMSSGPNWGHFLASWNLAVANSARLYFNDQSDLNVVSYVNGNNIAYVTGNWGLAGPSAMSGFRWEGCLAEVYLYLNQYMDFQLVSNRRKFISESGKPVFLGPDGSFPLGSAPHIYFRLDDGETVTNFATNRGTGGGFAQTGSGVLDAGSTSPSD